MRHITEETARLLDRVLATAEQISREHAAHQSYRRDAAKVMRERILTGYHQAQAEMALALAAELRQLRTQLQEAPRVTRQPAAVKTAHPGAA
jgi:hypothetical protein